MFRPGASSNSTFCTTGNHQQSLLDQAPPKTVSPMVSASISPYAMHQQKPSQLIGTGSARGSAATPMAAMNIALGKCVCSPPPRIPLHPWRRQARCRGPLRLRQTSDGATEAMWATARAQQQLFQPSMPDHSTDAPWDAWLRWIGKKQSNTPLTSASLASVLPHLVETSGHSHSTPHLPAIACSSSRLRLPTQGTADP